MYNSRSKGQYTVQLHTKHWVEAVCCGSVIYWTLVRIWIRGSIPLTDSDPAIFVSDLQDANKKSFCWYIYIIFQRKKVIKKSQNSRNLGFYRHFCWMIEGSGSEPLTNGSGSGRPKNILVWIISIWIRNTGYRSHLVKRPVLNSSARLYPRISLAER
jgi:hypothetical protein